MREGDNGFDGEQLKQIFDTIDETDDELAVLKAEHMVACKPAHTRRRTILKQAKRDGVNMNSLQALIYEHRLERKIAFKLAELEPDDAADAEAMREKLGAFADTPLGEAAIKRAEARSEQLDTLHG